MITLLCESYPDKLFTLPPALLQQVLVSVELGMFSFGHEITLHSCDIIQELAKYIYNEVDKGRPKNLVMAPFLNVKHFLFFTLLFRVIIRVYLNNYFQLLMSLIIHHQINSDLVTQTSIPLYYLICCYQEQYQQLVQTLIADQPDPATAQRLAAAFNELTENVVLDTKRIQRFRFCDNFDTFIVNVQGFLIVK